MTKGVGNLRDRSIGSLGRGVSSPSIVHICF